MDDTAESLAVIAPLEIVPETVVLLPRVIAEPVSVILESSNIEPLNLTTLFVTIFVTPTEVALIAPLEIVPTVMFGVPDNPPAVPVVFPVLVK